MLWFLSHFEFFPSGKFPEARFLVQDHGCLIVLGTCCDISLQGAVYFDDHIQGRVSFKSSELCPCTRAVAIPDSPLCSLGGRGAQGLLMAAHGGPGWAVGARPGVSQADTGLSLGAHNLVCETDAGSSAGTVGPCDLDIALCREATS